MTKRALAEALFFFSDDGRWDFLRPKTDGPVEFIEYPVGQIETVQVNREIL